jgi:hypothetical protein
LLPTALPSLRTLRRLYVENAPCELLVVGHADTKAGAQFNDKLSLERARATIAYLQDDVDAWLAFYDDGDASKRWGKVEDHLMLIALPDYRSKPLRESEVEFFQRTRGLKVDAKAGPVTRRALIREYMDLDGTSLLDFVGEINATAHGCGENFPLDERGEALDAAPQDQKRDRLDRRVELFFFDNEFGITPPVPGPNSAAGSIEYPLWRKRAVEVHDLRVDANGAKLQLVELEDVLFETTIGAVSDGVSAQASTPSTRRLRRRLARSWWNCRAKGQRRCAEVRSLQRGRVPLLEHIRPTIHASGRRIHPPCRSGRVHFAPNTRHFRPSSKRRCAWNR